MDLEELKIVLASIKDDVMSPVMKTYEEHLMLAIKARDDSQRTISELVKANLELTHNMERMREDFKDMLAGYREELHSAKDTINRLVEKQSGNKTEVHIDSNNKGN